MQVKAFIVALMGLSVAVDATEIVKRSPFASTLERRQQGREGNFEFNGGEVQRGRSGGRNGFRNQAQGGGNNDNGGQLNPNLIQKGSQSDGNNPPKDNQAPSLTDNFNFINFCQNAKALTDGKQVRTGSCNGIPMGNIPDVDTMISSVFISPRNGQVINELQTFNISVQTSNLAAGSFTNPQASYYSAPQSLNAQGKVIGHTHVVIQNTGKNLNPTQPLDPKVFAFFLGINDVGNGQGLLSATVTKGLPQGNYRLCSMTSASNHQPVLMPIAQRGAQDDCVRFFVRNPNRRTKPKTGNKAKNGAQNASLQGRDEELDDE